MVSTRRRLIRISGGEGHGAGDKSDKRGACTGGVVKLLALADVLVVAEGFVADVGLS